MIKKNTYEIVRLCRKYAVISLKSVAIYSKFHEMYSSAVDYSTFKSRTYNYFNTNPFPNNKRV